MISWIYPVLVVVGGQYPEVWVFMESPKGLAMEGSSIIIKKKKKTYSPLQITLAFVIGGWLNAVSFSYYMFVSHWNYF